MTDAQQTTHRLLARKKQAQTKAEESKAPIERLRYRSFSSTDDQASVADVMKPTLGELTQIQLPPNPLLQRAKELLARIHLRVL